MTLRLSSRTLRRLAATATIALACLGSVSTAAAQFGGRAGFDEAFRPDFLSRDVALFVETLSLEDWQRSILENLLDDYRVAFEGGVDDVKTRIQQSTHDVQGMAPEDVLKKIWGPIDDWSKKKTQLKAEFMENLKAQLSEQQQERWTKLDRALRREKTLERGELQGESVDLFVIVKELQLAQPALDDMQQQVEEFEEQLDVALSHRADVITAQQPKLANAMQSNDSRSGLAATESIMAARVAVRQAQDAGRDGLAEALRRAAGEEATEKFVRIALERGYPKIYRSDPILPLFDNARAAPDLTEEQTTSLEALEQQYRVEIVGVNKNLADAYRQEEPKEPRRRVEMMQARQAAADGSPRPAARTAEAEAISTARKAREEVYERYRKAILDILNEEQKKTMPSFGKGGPGVSRQDREAIAEQKRDGGRGPMPARGTSPLMTAPPRSREKGGRESDRMNQHPGGGNRPSQGSPARTAD